MTKTKMISITLDLSQSEHKRLSLLAQKKGMSLTQYILFCLEEKPFEENSEAMKKLFVE